jgi:hypothetical protein
MAFLKPVENAKTAAMLLLLFFPCCQIDAFIRFVGFGRARNNKLHLWLSRHKSFKANSRQR